jgi:diacylglycerol kinase (ATP)
VSTVREPKWPSRIRTLLLHNPTSGDGRHRADQLIMEACKSGLMVAYHSTKDLSYKGALRHRWDLVIVAGGDGTVAKVARQLRFRRTPIIILPVGTANNIARSLGLLTVEPIAHHLTGSLRDLNVGRARGPWGNLSFVESVGVGAIAGAISQSGQKPPKPFRIATGRDDLRDFLDKATPYHIEIAIDGEKYIGEFLFVEVLNLSFSGPSLAMAFSAMPDDRLFDVAFLAKQERGHMLEWLEGHPDQVPPPVAVHKGQKISLKWVGRPLRVDDRVFFHPEVATKIKIRFEATSLKVLTPRLFSGK